MLLLCAGLIPSIASASTKGQAIADATTILNQFGNYGAVFVSKTKTTAKDVNLSDTPGYTPVFQGIGWFATQYKSFAGWKVDLSQYTLSGIGLTYSESDPVYLYANYFRRNVNQGEDMKSGIYIGKNYIPLFSGGEVTQTKLMDGWVKVELKHKLTQSDFEQNKFLDFRDVQYGNTDPEKIKTQSLEIAGLTITAGEVDVTAYQDNLVISMIQKKIDELTARERKWQNKNWLAIGDSITYQNTYQAKVKNLLKLGNVSMDAKPGQQIGTMADRITSASLENVDLITVFGGTNDYGGNRKLGTINDDITASTFYGDVKKVIDKILTAKPTVRLVFVTPLQRGKFENQPIFPNPNGGGYKLDQYAKAIKEVCEQYSIPVLDLFSSAGINKYNLPSYTADNLHPNDAGSERIAQMLAAFLESI